MPLHQNNKLLLVHDKRCFVSHWPPASEIGMLRVTTFLELRMVAGRRRKLAGRQNAVRTLFPCRHPAATLSRTCRGLERSLSERHIRGMAAERHENGMVYVNQTRPHCVNQMGKTQSQPLAERHGRGTAWYVWIGLKTTQSLADCSSVQASNRQRARPISWVKRSVCTIYRLVTACSYCHCFSTLL
jgi:hypothetical protein